MSFFSSGNAISASAPRVAYQLPHVAHGWAGVGKRSAESEIVGHCEVLDGCLYADDLNRLRCSFERTGFASAMRSTGFSFILFARCSFKLLR